MSGWVIAAPRSHHGLGNRVRSVLGAKSLAEHTGRRFGYTWPTGARFGAAFDDLWDVNDRRVPEAVSTALRPLFPYRAHDLAWMSATEKSRVWQIRTAHALHLPAGAQTWGAQLRALRPVPEVSTHIADLTAQLPGEPYVGVMVRTHPISNAETLKHSPIEWFVDRMRQISQERPGVAFYISADTVDARATLRREFPTAVSREGEDVYNSADALRSSVSDLYLLAGSGHILAPHFSSFAEIAVQLAGDAVRLETSRTPAEQTLRAADQLGRAIDALQPARRRL